MTTITLKKPLAHNGETITTLTIDEPTLSGLAAYEETRAAGKGHYSAMAALLAAETGFPVAVTGRIGATDSKAIDEALAPFFAEESGGTGAPPSPKLRTSSDGATPS